MIHYTCDLCGGELSPEDERYLVQITLQRADDPLACTSTADDVDQLEELDEMMEHAALSEETSEPSDAPEQMQFDLCPTCRKKFLKNPLGREASPLHFSKN